MNSYLTPTFLVLRLSNFLVNLKFYVTNFEFNSFILSLSFSYLKRFLFNYSFSVIRLDKVFLNSS